MTIAGVLRRLRVPSLIGVLKGEPLFAPDDRDPDNTLAWVLKGGPHVMTHTTLGGNGSRGAAQKLQGPRRALDASSIVQSALPDYRDQQRYYALVQKARDALAAEGTTKEQHTAPGGGYTKDRLAVHREIVGALIGDKNRYMPEPGEKPTFKVVAGRGGSGKSNFNVKNSPSTAVYDPKKEVVIDPDTIKELLPGYEPYRAAQYHQESADIAAKALRAAKDMGVNAVLDTTLAYPQDNLVQRFKDAGYTTEAHYMSRPESFSAQNAVQRTLKPSEKGKFDHGLTYFPKHLDSPDNP